MMPEAIVDAIEPAAKDAVGDGLSDEALALASIAISLKRIADSFAPSNGQDIGSTLFYMEQRLGPQS